MQLKEMKLGKSIEIFVKREDYNFRLVSKVEYVEEGRVGITLISAKGRPFIFQKTDDIYFIYKDDKRMWKFSELTAGIAKLDDDYLHCFETKKEGESYNRRKAFRVYYGEEAVFRLAKEGFEDILSDEKEARKEENAPFIRKGVYGLIKDISETGAGICLKEHAEINDFVFFEVPTEFGVIRCKGKITRIAEEFTGSYHNLYGVVFTETTSNIQKFVFALQRLQLQKRK